MKGMKSDLYVFNKVLEKKLPKVHAQLLHLGNDPLAPCCLRWFQTLFSGSLPLEVISLKFFFFLQNFLLTIKTKFKKVCP